MPKMNTNFYTNKQKNYKPYKKKNKYMIEPLLYLPKIKKNK